MKCPKCGFHSFDHLDDCKKCGNDLTAHKNKYNLRGLHAPGQSAPAMTAPAAAPEAETPVAETPAGPGGDNVDFGFDFLDEEDSVTGAEQKVDIDQPFDIDSETVPADTKDKSKGEDTGFSF